jgi:hypothetical protein
MKLTVDLFSLTLNTRIQYKFNNANESTQQHSHITSTTSTSIRHTHRITTHKHIPHVNTKTPAHHIESTHQHINISTHVNIPVSPYQHISISTQSSTHIKVSNVTAASTHQRIRTNANNQHVNTVKSQHFNYRNT